MIVQGDSHEVLPQILDTHANKVKCIYIDPPYNNREQYNHYVDDVAPRTLAEKHSQDSITPPPFAPKGRIYLDFH